MFHFPHSPHTPYTFKRMRPGITPARFPHSDTLGSQFACQLPEAYRRLPRPSSAFHTKASTERPKTPTKQKTTQPTHPQKMHEPRCSRPLYENQPPHQHPTTTPQKRQPQEQHGHRTQEPDSAQMPQAFHKNKHPPRPQQAQAQRCLPRKEVIQPHLPVRLPCYDFVPIANPTFDRSPQKTG